MEQVNPGAGMAADGLTWPAGGTQWEKAHLPGSTNVQDGVVGARHEQPDASRVALLEASLRSTQSHNVNLQHNVAFLQAQNVGHLGHITKLQTRVLALESELTSLKANSSLGANPVPASSKATNSVAVDSVAAHPVAAGATPPLSPAPAPAEDIHRPLPDQQREPTPPSPAAPGVVGNYALWDLRPKDANGSGGSGSALTTSGPSESGAVPPETTAQAARSPSPTQTPEPAANSFSGAPDDVQQVDSSADPASIQTAPAGTSSSVVAEQAESLSSCDSTTPTAAKAQASATSRHPLHDFWADNSRENPDNSPPARNARNRGLGDDSARKRSKSSIPNGPIASNEDNADRGKTLEPVHDDVGHRTRGAEERETVSEATAAVKAEPVAPSEPTCRTGGTPVLWCATEGREGAEDRSSHLVDCALCQDPLPEDESIGRCGACPRSFCTQCLEHGLHEEGVDLEGLDQDSRAILDGGKGDFFVEQCPHCIRGCNDNFTALSPGAVPMEHLLNELMRHDLSICFREPVDTDKHPDYVEAIGRDAMTDLGTMMDKLKRKKYPRRRGPGQFLEDLNRIWRNCRRYAGCDELGQPHFGTTVPGIVRCALILEAMSIKFCAAYMSDNQGTEPWQESTWDFHRQRQERMNAEARLEQLKNQGKASESKKAKPVESSGVGGQNVSANQECREGSTINGSAEGKLPEEENGKPGDDGDGTGSCSVQQPTTASSDGGVRKRNAAEMEGGPHTERADAGAKAVARTVLEATGETSGGTPNPRRPSAGKAKLQQPPWSPLDRLCDLASTFHK